jgi:hypothetical protein
MPLGLNVRRVIALGPLWGPCECGWRPRCERRVLRIGFAGGARSGRLEGMEEALNQRMGGKAAPYTPFGSCNRPGGS